MGALGGAILGGAIEGVPRAIRALRYYGTLKAGKAPPGVSPATHEAAIQKAEEALVSGDDPLQAVRDVLAAEPMPKREPLILTPDMSVTARTPEPTPLAPGPITTQSLPPVEGNAPTTPGETAAMAEEALNEAVALRAGAIGNKKTPFLHALKKSGVKVNPDSPEGQTLKAIGLTHKTMPGLFSRKATGDRTALDTLVANEWEDRFPGIWEATGTPRDTSGSGGEYLDMNGVMDIIRREQGGDFSWMRAIDDANRLERDVAALDNYKPQDAYLDMNPDQAEFFVDLNARQFDDADWEGTLEKDFAAYVSGRNITLLPRESAEILSVLKQRGGDAADLVDRALERELDETEYALLRRMRGDDVRKTQADDLPFGDPEPVAASTGGTGRGAFGEPEVAAGNAAEPGAGGGELPGFERTDAGVQSVIPGSRVNDSAARQAEQAKAEAAAKAIQSKMRKNGQIRVEDDVNGLFAVKQLDIFDDINSPEAQAFMDANVQGMRDILEAEGDIAMDAAVMADDGSALNSLSSILREIDDMDTLASEFAKCRTGATE